ncbi:MAG: hypothetical protein KC591_13530, partial [Gemmatimonadetes bacterium]|nr:hypothetical protein [Gemmatimonadota bacterium]
MPGVAIAAVAAGTMLSRNALTINPMSAAVVLGLWIAFGALTGAAAAWLGGRAATVLRLPARAIA